MYFVIHKRFLNPSQELQTRIIQAIDHFFFNSAIQQLRLPAFVYAIVDLEKWLIASINRVHVLGVVLGRHFVMGMIWS